MLLLRLENLEIGLRALEQHAGACEDDVRENGVGTGWNGATGEYVRALGYDDKHLRLDFLFSYQPVPGTVIFLGYGSRMFDPDDPFRRGLLRESDGFFLKLSYLFRV